MGTPLNAQVSEVTHICDIRLARFCIWTNRVNPLLQAAKIMYEHNPWKNRQLNLEDAAQKHAQARHAQSIPLPESDVAGCTAA